MHKFYLILFQIGHSVQEHNIIAAQARTGHGRVHCKINRTDIFFFMQGLIKVKIEFYSIKFECIYYYSVKTYFRTPELVGLAHQFCAS